MSNVIAASIPLRDRLKPSNLLKLLVTPKLLRFVGLERVERIDRVINNNVMVKLRQRQCRNQPTDGDTADYLKTRFCPEPFRTLETTHTGLAYVCCSVWLPTPIGTLDENPETMWNGPVARDIRASILDGSFRHCNHLHCPLIANRTLPSRDDPEAKATIEAYASPSPPKLPTNVNLSHDKSCNLSCPSCRSDLYLAKKTKQIELDTLTDRFVLPLLKDAETVMITGSGDPFASNHFRSIIKKLTPEAYPKLRFNLITNGQLCDARAWADLCLGSRVDNVHVSVDAATSETYAFVRRLGDFSRLRKNLAFLKRLHDEEVIGKPGLLDGRAGPQFPRDGGAGRHGARVRRRLRAFPDDPSARHLQPRGIRDGLRRQPDAPRIRGFRRNRRVAEPARSPEARRSTHRDGQRSRLRRRAIVGEAIIGEIRAEAL